MSDNSIAARMHRYAEGPLEEVSRKLNRWMAEANERRDYLSVTCYERAQDAILDEMNRLDEQYDRWDPTEKEDV